jgi:hypothetical protein
MKYASFFKIVLSGFIVLFLAASCVKEGPMGPPGADGIDGIDGADGVDGHVTCLACHSSESMDRIQAEFSMSVHRAGMNAVDYAGARAACARCHSHEGFVQFAELGGVVGDITNPTAWKCNTCHGIHETFDVTDYALRLTDPINPFSNPQATMDLVGNNNLCANCHQSRAPEPNVATPDAETFRITSNRYGPHYSTQANVVAGMGLAEIPGSVAYPQAGSNYHLNEQASCTGCHMGEFTNRSGGHTWIPSVSSCNSCHETEDFNYGGRQTDVAAKLVQIREKLVEFGVIAGSDETGYMPLPGTYSMVLVRAFFNWDAIYKDRSLGVHNPRYVNALLVNTLEALNAYEPAPEV